jgi:hypothetical protein
MGVALWCLNGIPISQSKSKLLFQSFVLEKYRAPRNDQTSLEVLRKQTERG